MTTVGLDIGGANIKAADETGLAKSCPFAIWNHRDRLKDQITQILSQFPRFHRVAVTMTAELADCYQTKSEGVHHILDSVEESVRQVIFNSDEVARPMVAGPSDNQTVPDVVVWTTDGGFVSPDEARQNTLKVAAANWHALATWCGSLVPAGPGLLVDIGTTTTDIIPLIDGKPVPTGLTDVARMQSGELSYSGVWRTPLCAVAHSVPFHDGYCSLAAELFATTLDVYLLLGLIPENDLNVDTANGKPATKAAAHDRMARTLCGDRAEIAIDEATQIAKFLADVQRQRLAGSLERVVQRLPSICQNVIISGSGSFLARQIIDQNRLTKNAKQITLADQFSPEVAVAACAYAVAKLAALGARNSR